MGLTEEQMDTIIEAHSDTVDGLKASCRSTRRTPKSSPRAEGAGRPESQKAMTGWKDKHDKVKREFDEYKEEQTKKETRSAKESAYRELLKACRYQRQTS